jgi:hypothetical protein
MKLRIWLIISSLLIVSCSSLPDKPSGDLCIIDIKDNELVCAPLSSIKINMSFKEFLALEKDNVIPLSQADNYVAFSPETYGNIQAYINKLELMAEQCQTSTSR